MADILNTIDDLLKDHDLLYFKVNKRSSINNVFYGEDVLTLDLGTAFAAITMVRAISDEELLFLNMQSKTQFVNHKDFLSVLEILLE